MGNESLKYDPYATIRQREKDITVLLQHFFFLFCTGVWRGHMRELLCNSRNVEAWLAKSREGNVVKRSLIAYMEYKTHHLVVKNAST